MFGAGVVGDRVVGARFVKIGVEGAGVAVVSVDGAIGLGDGVVGDSVVRARVIGASVEISGEGGGWCRGSKRVRSMCGRRWSRWSQGC